MFEKIIINAVKREISHTGGISFSPMNGIFFSTEVRKAGVDIARVITRIIQIGIDEVGPPRM